MQSVAPSLGMELTPIDLRQPDEIERDIINLKTAKALGLAVPQSLTARADAVIE